MTDTEKRLLTQLEKAVKVIHFMAFESYETENLSRDFRGCANENMESMKALIEEVKAQDD